MLRFRLWYMQHYKLLKEVLHTHNVTFFYLIIRLLPSSQLLLVKSKLLIDKGSFFFPRTNLFRMRISTEELLFKISTSTQHQTFHSSYLFRKAYFWEKQYSTAPTFRESYTVWKVSLFGAFLLRIFLHSDLIRIDYPYLSVFSPNAGKYGSE